MLKQNMINRRKDRAFEKLPSIRDTVINGDLLLTSRSHREERSIIGYEQERESKIYKRTRLNLGSTKQMQKWPASLLLSGRKMIDEFPPERQTEKSASVDEKLESNGDNDNKIDMLSERVMLLEPSKSFYSDFGLRSTQNTDTFSGYKNRRKKHKSQASVEKELEKKALKHIHAMQVLSNSKRGSHASRCVNSLKETLSPVRSNTEVVLPTSFVRSELSYQANSPEHHSKAITFNDVSRKPPYNMLIRTREAQTKSIRQNTFLPEISGRTLVGFDAKSTA